VQKKKKKPAAGFADPEAGEVEAAADDEVPAAAHADGAEDGEPTAKTASQIKREKQKAAAARKKAEADAVGSTSEAERKEDAMRAASAAISWSTEMRGIKTWTSFPAAEKGGTEQTWPPTVPVSKMFPSGNVPMGEQVEYTGDQQYRTTKAELRELERLQNIQYQELRTAAECHRQVRAHALAAAPWALPRQLCAPALRPPAQIG
jgi:methionyl aminopeptidase